ncbi:MAG: hypothetical protein J4O04_01425, partial [Chloroflexi bacterium]|nr:hypothetical protein [Chloroflexota bacterium]
HSPRSSRAHTSCRRRGTGRSPRRAGVHPARPAPTGTRPARRNGTRRLGDIVASWLYCDAEGRALFRVVKLLGPDGKTFLQQHPAGSCANHADDPEPCKPAGNGWRWGRGGAPYALYRLPELIAAARDAFVFAVEGEACADAIVGLGLVATTSAGGAGKWGLGAHEYAEALRDRRVVILPDNDRPGADHAEDIAGSLLAVAAELRSIILPGLPFKGDIVDWLRVGGNREQLLALVERAPIMRAPSEMFPRAVDCRVLDATGISA